MLKKIVRSIPIVGPWAQRLWRAVRRTHFTGSADYWVNRYATGGNSGAGSHGELATFKAEVVNSFVREHGIGSVIEFGCGDGRQLLLGDYPRYLGFDISPEALIQCRRRFTEDASKQFRHLDEYAGERAELSLSLDVIYHLIEDRVYSDYMQRLFDSATRAVIIYSSNGDPNGRADAAHVRHRRFTEWVAQSRPGWLLSRHLPNRYPYGSSNGLGSFAEFFIFEPRSTGMASRRET
jgi:SAM-dependent methyltransferase